MNTQQAKNILLIELMSKLGHEPLAKERGGREYKYLSPFRVEEMPSFNVNLDKNCFFDFGESEGGNTLDFAILYLRSRGQSSSVSDALSWLDAIMGSPSVHMLKTDPDLFKTKSADAEEGGDPSSLEFIKAMPLRSKRVLEYLRDERSIPEALAQKYLSLVQYNNLKKPRAEGKPYYAFGMRNTSDGWEIRSATDNPSFKSALVARDISVVKGNGSRGSTVLVFEGMLDFLSVNSGQTDPPIPI